MIIFLFTFGYSKAQINQNVNLDKIDDNFKKENLLKISGGISADGVYQSGGGGSLAQPFTGYLNGNLNAKLFNMIDIPLSFFVSNEGVGHSFPTLPNRLSLNPTYKWVKVHVGEIAMTFSPYTVNGHLFTGVGIDVAPPKTNIVISALYGRFQKAVAYDSSNKSVPAAYQRMGYGVKISYTKNKYHLGYSVFAAKDNVNSITYVPDSLNIKPLKNLVMSAEGSLKVTKNLSINGEYASSAMTGNTTDTIKVAPVSDVLYPFVKANATTNFYHALNAGLNYRLNKTTLGLRYERIDPGYLTLGAYFFNQDLESYTINLSQQLWKNKVSLSGSFGYQHDNLLNNNEKTNTRMVGSINANYADGGKLMLSGSYSSFQTFMHINSQFAIINQIGPYVNLDTLNFSQISQNAMLLANYMFSRSKTRSQGINITFNYFDVTSMQGNVATTDGSSQFYNTGVSYVLQLIGSGISVNGGFNSTYNVVGMASTSTLGPMGSISAPFFKKKLMSTFNTSYNISSETGKEYFNTRLSLSYNLSKKQNLGFSVSNQQSKTSTGNLDVVMITLGYRYSF